MSTSPSTARPSTARTAARKTASRTAKTQAAQPAPAAPAAPRPRRTQEQRREASEQRMLDAALTLVAEKGTFRVTLAEIGERAGYSRGLPAHRFGSKAGLLAALATFIHERFGQQWMSEPAEPGLPTIEAVIRAYFTRDPSSLTTTRALIVMMAESGLGDSELQPILADYNRKRCSYYAHHIGLAQQAGQARADVDAHSLAVVVLAVFRGAMLQHLNDPDIQLDRVRDEVLALVRERLAIR